MVRLALYSSHQLDLYYMVRIKSKVHFFPFRRNIDTCAFKVIFDNKVILEAFGPRILRQGKYFKTE